MQNDASHTRTRRPVRIRVLNAIVILAAVVLALLAFVTLDHITASERMSEQSNRTYIDCAAAARDLQEGSDYLTSHVRVYISTGDRSYMDAFLDELLVYDRRGKAVETLRTYLGSETSAVVDLEQALKLSNELAERELYAMRLTAAATGLEDIPPLVAEVELSEEDAALSPEEQRELASEIVLGVEYQTSKGQISAAVRACSDQLLKETEETSNLTYTDMRSWIWRMQAIVILLLCLIVFVIFAVIFLILWPLATHTHEIKHGKKLAPTGARELRYLSDAYNQIYDENQARTESLQHAAERDPLTGLYNRGAYDKLLREHKRDVALLLVDVDYFKEVNDTYGHDTGDAVLKKVADLLKTSFRLTDYPCRMGGDEFAVIMTNMNPSLQHVIQAKVSHVSQALQDDSAGLPPVTLSIGVAFSVAGLGEDELYKAANKALYEVKQRGRNGCAFFGEGGLR